MRTIIFATGNEGKMKEIREILDGSGWQVLSQREAGIDCEVEENGTSFEENALLKAEGIRNWCLENGIPNFPELNLRELAVLADDSGLEVDALGGEPGIYSARYLGHDTSYREKNAHIMERLDGLPKQSRTARFVCVIAAAFFDGHSHLARGAVEGYIGWEERGENGFGYDPIFYLFENDRSTAELSPEEKNAVSHRGKALRRMRELLEEEYNK
ncbi:MAG: RdgB/HAM1 family non-canonical purine NTP pyrophosphatase [Eubacteriales bacterium]|nr:RdgB/HAM1 family non-canonical purine NTP pyrophosphatase [Eubacteriales bacterium]